MCRRMPRSLKEQRPVDESAITRRIGAGHFVESGGDFSAVTGGHTPAVGTGSSSASASIRARPLSIG